MPCQLLWYFISLAAMQSQKLLTTSGNDQIAMYMMAAVSDVPLNEDEEEKDADGDDDSDDDDDNNDD